MLSNCNTLSATRLERASKDFRGHINHLNEMKQDLESVFKRIRAIKTKLSVQHPDAFIGMYFQNEKYHVNQQCCPGGNCPETPGDPPQGVSGFFDLNHW